MLRPQMHKASSYMMFQPSDNPIKAKNYQIYELLYIAKWFQIFVRKKDEPHVRNFFESLILMFYRKTMVMFKQEEQRLSSYEDPH